MSHKHPRRDRLHCFYCGIILTKKRTIDHIKPKCTGGGLLGPENKVACCKKCNQEKAYRNIEEYRDYLFKIRGEYVLFYGERDDIILVQGSQYRYIPEVYNPRRPKLGIIKGRV